MLSFLVAFWIDTVRSNTVFRVRANQQEFLLHGVCKINGPDTGHNRPRENSADETERLYSQLGLFQSPSLFFLHFLFSQLLSLFLLSQSLQFLPLLFLR